MIAVCQKCRREWNWSPDTKRCPFCGADEKEIEVYNEI